MERPKDSFFELMRGWSLTFDDVRLKTGPSKVMPDDVDLTSRFSRHIPLLTPIVSAAMDTVTRHKMAIAMAKAGGMGIIDKNLSPEDQAKQVRKVKLHLGGLIEHPFCAFADQTMAEIMHYLISHDFDFRTVPVLDRDDRLVGILTSKDFKFCLNEQNLASDEMTTELITGWPEITPDEAFDLMRQRNHKVSTLPLVDNGRVVAMYAFEGLQRTLFPDAGTYNLDDQGHLRVGAAVGVGESALKRAELLVAKDVDVLVVDTAHGDSDPVIEIVRRLKHEFPDTDVVAGNVSEGRSALALVLAGADGIKVGQGPGSICITRMVSGIGNGQVTAVHECEMAIRDSGIPICADGGIEYTGDIPIILGAGADSVMLGSALAGTNESPGEVVYVRGAPVKVYRGMGSKKALEANTESRARYGETNTGKNKSVVPEGIEATVPYRGGVAGVIHQYVGGLRKGMGYVGAATIAELHQKADFRRTTSASQHEAHPHGIDNIEEAPNYRRGG